MIVILLVSRDEQLIRAKKQETLLHRDGAHETTSLKNGAHAKH